MKLMAWVNFNIVQQFQQLLQALKRLTGLTIFYALLGSARVQAPCKMLVKLPPELEPIKRAVFQQKGRNRLLGVVELTFEKL